MTPSLPVTTLSPLTDTGHTTGERLPVLLIVDDQSANIQTLYRAFSQDHQVLMALNARAALEVCEKQAPDLILLDIMMPDIDGYALCETLKADALTRDIPVIFVTAQNDEAAETRGLEAGAVDFISKPINPAIVRARVKTHLTLKAQSDLLRRWVYVDGLTGVANRRHFDERLTQEWSRAMRQGTTLSVVLLDVDHFKRYNDRYGHLSGDQCLRTIGQSLQQNARRPADLVARYGGEEFACILPDTDLDGAMHCARQLGEAICALALPHAEAGGTQVVTVSLGVCSTRPSAGRGDASDLLQTADQQLYAAKAQGRDRACGQLLD
ncbi:diguanylate cyclase [Comamonadaceae bacterium G21597-S1]|nr:diguanylate cyclase [Comamonadaceae bacterium G21597-S1]